MSDISLQGMDTLLLFFPEFIFTGEVCPKMKIGSGKKIYNAR
jgi:hypothetical protein